jgi:mannosyltransferase OCH1-like enzyme
MIPRIIHQTWKTSDVPERWRPLQQSWRDNHPDYEYRYWTDAANRRFVAEKYPQYLEVYDGYRMGVHRADMVRYLIVNHFGGIYVDMDFESLKALDDLIAGKQLVFGLEPETHAARAPVLQRGLSRIVCNAFIASEAGHRFWDFFLPRLPSLKDEEDVLDATGPFALTRACDTYPRPEEITIVPATLLYPVDNEQIRKFERKELEHLLVDAYAVHHWQGTWFQSAVIMDARSRILRSRAGGVKPAP